MAKFADKSTKQHTNDLLAEIRKMGGGTLNRQIALNVWVGKARQSGIPEDKRKAVVTAVNNASV